MPTVCLVPLLLRFTEAPGLPIEVDIPDLLKLSRMPGRILTDFLKRNPKIMTFPTSFIRLSQVD